jgi:RimJ/RimL family protein N-acetyltransferase
MAGVYFDHGTIRFRSIREEDLPLIQELRNDPSTWMQLGDPRPLKPGLQKKWLEALDSSSDRFYYIAENAHGIPVGMVRMDEYDPINRSIRVGADVLPAQRRKHYGLAIYSAIKEYGFAHLGLHRIWLLVLSTNTAARQLYAAAGFRMEGTLRQAVFRNGKWVDYISMSILERDTRVRI